MLIKFLPPMTSSIATMIGLTAILLWGSNVGLIRTVTADFGAIGGTTLIYSIATIILFLTIGLPKFTTVPKSYLVLGSILFVICELCFSLSIGFAQNSQQAIEIAMVNYLWPMFTLIFAMIFNSVRSNLLIIPGFILALLGIVWILSGGQGINVQQMLNNVEKNPLSYSLALASVISWASYCSITLKKANGSNLVTLFFGLATLVLWIKYIIFEGQAFYFTSDNILNVIMAATALGLGYGAWNIGIIYGNITILAGASYLTPVFSAFFATLILNTSLSMSFWQGMVMVTAGAILCWLSTRASNPS